MKIQLEIPKDREQELQSLKSATALVTYKDLFNNALSIFEWAVKETQEGRIIAVVDEGGMEYRALKMPALKHAANAKSPSVGSGSSPAPAL